MKHRPVVGIIGGGQLGRMFIEEALRYNLKCIVLDADKNCPASVIAHQHIVGSIAEAGPLLQLAEVCDVLTYEIEHIFIQPLLELEKQGKKLIPSPRILQMVQDKGLQKKFYADNQIPTAPFRIVNKPDEWLNALNEMSVKKFAAKLCREGYDGKGVALMTTDEVISNPEKIPFTSQTVLEKFIPCKKELAVIVGRDVQGHMKTFPVCEMEFDEKANLVTFLFSPAQISEQKKNEAEQLALKVVDALGGPGLFAIEMFMDDDEKLWVNEMAPRPHNSGHHTIEACYTSQYEQLLRILLHQPLGSTAQLKPAAMINILGSKDFSGTYYLAGEEEILKTEGVYIHMYGKTTSKPMRKLGHVTVMANSIEELKTKARMVADTLSVEAV